MAGSPKTSSNKSPRWRGKRTWLVALAGFVIIALVIAFIVSLYPSYWTGFGESTALMRTTTETVGNVTVTTTQETRPPKLLWDWIALLGVPFVLAVAAFLFNRSERENERRIASDQSMDTILQSYLDYMTDLLLDRDLRNSKPDSEVRNIAHVRTVTTLRRLDSRRNQTLLDFLLYSELTGPDTQYIVSLKGSDLRGVDLRDVSLLRYDLETVDFSGADLRGATLRGANLTGAKLVGAKLAKAELDGANLWGANLEDADLFGADFQYANLEGASVTMRQLAKARIYTGAKLPDGSHKRP